MATLAYHVISTEVENHILKHNCIFRHLCIYKQPTSTKQWKFNIFVQILSSYFRYTGRHFLGCALFLLAVILSEDSYTEKSTQKYLCEGHHFFDCTPSILCFFAAFLVYSLSLPKRHTCRMTAIKIYIAMSGILCDNIMSKQSKI